MEPSEQKSMLEAKAKDLLSQQNQLDSKLSDQVENSIKTTDDLKQLDLNLIGIGAKVKELAGETPAATEFAEDRLQILGVRFCCYAEFCNKHFKISVNFGFLLPLLSESHHFSCCCFELKTCHELLIPTY